MGSYGRLGAAVHDDGAGLRQEAAESFLKVAPERNALSELHASLLVPVVENRARRIRTRIQFGTQEQICLRPISNKRRALVFESISSFEDGRSEDLPLGVDYNPLDFGGQQGHLRQERRQLQFRTEGKRFLHSGIDFLNKFISLHNSNNLVLPIKYVSLTGN